MCAHIGQNRHIYPPSIFRLHFRLVPPPPFPQVDGGGCYREKFFLILFFLILSRNLVNGFLRLNNFFIFSDFVIILVWFWLSDYRLIISIFNLLILTRFGYSWLSSSTRLCFALCLLVYDSLIRFWISTRINFDLFQHCRFYALTLQLFISLTLLLVINKHLCLYEFVLCLFWLF